MFQDHRPATRPTILDRGRQAARPAACERKGQVPVVPLADLRRIASIAARAACRSAGPDAAVAAAEWMETPRSLFGGLRAIEACADPRHYLRAVTAQDLGLEDEVSDVVLEMLMAPASEEELAGLERRMAQTEARRSSPSGNVRTCGNLCSDAGVHGTGAIPKTRRGAHSRRAFRRTVVVDARVGPESVDGATTGRSMFSSGMAEAFAGVSRKFTSYAVHGYEASQARGCGA